MAIFAYDELKDASRAVRFGVISVDECCNGARRADQLHNQDIRHRLYSGVLRTVLYMGQYRKREDYPPKRRKNGSNTELVGSIRAAQRPTPVEWM